MAQTPLIDRLEVVYTKYDNQGKITTEQIKLTELMKKDIGFKRQIFKLAFLPVFNVDKSLSTQGEKIPEYIFENFPGLTFLGYPSQFTTIDIAKIQRQCPNLSQIDRIVPKDYYKGAEKPQDIRIKMNDIVMDEQPSEAEKTEDYAFGHIDSVESYSIIYVNPKKVSNRQPRPAAVTNADIMVAINNLYVDLTNNNNVVTRIDNFEENILNILNGFVGKISSEQLEAIITVIKQTIKTSTIDSEKALVEAVQTTIQRNFDELFKELKSREDSKYEAFLNELVVIKQNTIDEKEAIALIKQRIEEVLPQLLASNEHFQTNVYAKLGIINNNLLEMNDDQEKFRELCLGELGTLNGLISKLATDEQIKGIIRSAFAEFSQEMSAKQEKFFGQIKEEIAKLPTVDTMREIVAESVVDTVEEVNFHTDLVAEHIINGIIGNGVHLSDVDKQDILKILSAVQGLATSEQAEGITIRLDNETILNNARFVHLKDKQNAIADKINSEALLGEERHRQLVAKLAELKIDDAKITEIVDTAVGQTSIATQAIVGRIVNAAVDKIIEANGKLAQVNRLDEEQIKKIVQGLTSSEEFKSFLNEVIDSKKFATAEGLKELDRLINGGFDITVGAIEESKSLMIEKFDSLMKQLTSGLDGLATKEQIDRMISRAEDGEIQGLIPESVRQIVQEELAKAGLVTKQDLSGFEQTMSTQITNIMTQLGPVFALIQKNGGIVNNVTNNYTTTPASESSDSTPTINVETNIDIKQINEIVQNAVRSIVSMYVINNAITNNYMQGFGLGGGMMMPNYAPIFALIATAMGGNNITMPPQLNIDNTQIMNIINMIIKTMGIPQATNNPEVDKLKAEIEALKKKQEEDMAKLLKELEEIKNSLKGGTPPSKTDDDKKPPLPPDKKDGDKKEPKKDPIERPKPVGKQKLVAGTIEHLNRIQEPKMSLLKRIGKFIIRHPLGAAGIGVGIGLTGGAGAAIATSAIKFGGLTAGMTALGTMANFFLPTLLIGAGIGAGVPLAIGAVGGIISRFSKKGKKERLYAKFLREKAKCDALAQKIEEKEIAQAIAQEKVQQARENQRHGSKILKKLGIYKLARNHNRKKYRKLRAQIRETENRRDAKVAKALATKRTLNSMEDADHKSLAMGGYLQKLRREKAGLEARLADPTLDEEERQDIMEDIETAIEDAEDEVAGISTLGDGYKTFDTEAEELITSVKRKSPAMKDILTEIQSRNSKRTLHTVERPVFDQKEVEAYIARAKASKDPEEIANAEKIQAYMEDVRTNKTSITALVRDGKISPRLASQLMVKNSIEVAPTEVVDIEFKEVVEAPEDTEEKTK